VRRPVAVSILTFILALSTKLVQKNTLGRQGGEGFAARSNFMGVGLTNKTLGSIGVGNIGSEMFRLAKPLDMRFLAHDPFADAAACLEAGVSLVPLDVLFSEVGVGVGVGVGVC
jgi:phosphoglycerate dehydrogenase-like enzyme